MIVQYLKGAEMLGMRCVWIVYPQRYAEGICECDLIWIHGVFADVIKLRWGHPGLVWVLNPMTSYFIGKDKFGHRHTTYFYHFKPPTLWYFAMAALGN